MNQASDDQTLKVWDMTSIENKNPPNKKKRSKANQNPNPTQKKVKLDNGKNPQQKD